ITVHLGNYVTHNAESFFTGSLSWKAILSLLIGTFFLCAILFINWRALIQKKRFLLNFHIWKRSADDQQAGDGAESI
ncbi:MAG: hypothetical protein JSU01_01570, partial [Bacteroidetes bacterium]|nr:hypothetical protein [Bacteroidota bacterium]